MHTSSEYQKQVCLGSALCAVVLQVCLPIRLGQLLRCKPKTTSSYKSWWSSACSSLLFVILLSASAALELEQPLRISLLASCGAALGLSILLHFEHQRSSLPPDLAIVYLVAVLLFDLILLTLPSGTESDIISHPVVAVRLVQHAILLGIELCIPDSNLRDETTPLDIPEQRSSILGRALFSWTIPFLFQKFDSIDALHALPPLSRDIHPHYTKRLVMHAWAKRARPEKRLALPLALFKSIRTPFLMAAIPRLFLIVFKYTQPKLIRETILYAGDDASMNYASRGYWLVVSAIAIYTAIAISGAVYQHGLNKLKLMLRSMLISLINAKALELPSIAYDDGEANALMSNDVDHLKTMIDIIHETWGYLIEVVIGVVLLAKEVGWIWPLPLALVFVFSRTGVYVTRNLLVDQKAWNQATQDRIAATSSMISSLKVVKMLGLQRALTERIESLRRHEIDLAAKVRWVMVYYNACANSVGIFSPAFTLITFAVIAQAHGSLMDTATAFTTIATLNMIMHPTNMIMTAWPRLTAALASFDRIQAFLVKPPLADYRAMTMKMPRATSASDKKGHESSWPNKSSSPEEVAAISVCDLVPEPFKRPVDLQLAPNTLTIISGPLGSGKTTLLRCLLGELPPTRGTVCLSTRRIAYCAQAPWLPGGTIRSIIRGDNARDVDDGFYRQVVEACCLAHDIQLLPMGDETPVGSRGSTLSGGLMQRVSLARAVFARCEMVFLDDPFSALDGDTERTIFTNLLGESGLLRQLRCTLILTGNSPQYFSSADHVVILGEGGVVEQGPWRTLSANATAMMREYQVQKPSAKRIETPIIARSGSKEKIIETEKFERSGDVALYGYYFKFTGRFNLAVLVGWAAAYAFFVSMPQLWVRLWTEADGNSTWYYVTGFMLLCIFALASTHGTIWATVIKLAPESGLRIHQHLLNIVMNAPLSYFSTAENGSVLNRFSQDIQYIDQELPMTIASVSNQIFKLCTQALLLYTAQTLLALSLPVCFVVIYVVQRLYMRSSRQLQLLELESRSAIFTDFLKSVEGLSTIRAFGWRRAVGRENVTNVHASQTAEFLRLSLQRWLNLTLDLTGAAMAVIVIATVVRYRETISPGQAGVALNVMLVANATLLKLIDGWTTFELNLGAMARIRSLEKTVAPERSSRTLDETPTCWPTRGAVRITGAVASYQSGIVALRDINLEIPAGRKLVIHGRTGGGKSSLILSLLRMIDLQSGKIEIDNVDITTVDPDTLRRQCFVTASQDALLLPNETLRFNLDPDGSLHDEGIADEMDRLGLGAQLMMRQGQQQEGGVQGDDSATVLRRILDTKVADLPELSSGQRQLLAFCRALIRIGALRAANLRPVILLDEPTSSLDTATEAAVLDMIDRELVGRGHTVIIVTHRTGGLVGLGDRDVVMHMADGQMSPGFEGDSASPFSIDD